jgi:hypothetical protein
MATPNDPTMSQSSLDAVIAAYMLAFEHWPGFCPLRWTGSMTPRPTPFATS